MLDSVPVAKLVMDSAPMNLFAAATGGIVDPVKTTASPQGFTMRIPAKKMMEHVVVEASGTVNAALECAVQGLDFVGRASYTVLGKMVSNPMTRSTRASKL